MVGAGFSGATAAERITALLGKRVLVIDQRPHAGGNAFDFRDPHGILVHQYGPHIFHTKSKKVWDYLSRFTEWHPYRHRVLASVDGSKFPIPFNLDTLHSLFPPDQAFPLEKALIERYGDGGSVSVLELRKSEDVRLRELGNFVYEKIFLNYTVKAWGVRPDELSPEVAGRVPVRISRDDRYFQDPHQGMPLEGYSALFDKMLRNPDIGLMLNTDYRSVIRPDFEQGKIYLDGKVFEGRIVFTGMPDELCDFEFGRLPYRSLEFRSALLERPVYQPNSVVNYPNEFKFTRVTEYKHFYAPVGEDAMGGAGWKSRKTVVSWEYARAFRQGDIPYYPIPSEETFRLFARYREKAARLKNLFLLGRLGEYRYINMDEAVGRALDLIESWADASPIPEGRREIVGEKTKEAVRG